MPQRYPRTFRKRYRDVLGPRSFGFGRGTPAQPVSADPGGAVDYSTFVSTYDDGTNGAHYQQQIVAAIAVP
jgi:hypothetical protein